MIKKFHTPTYLLSKFKLRVFELKHPDAPWLTADSIRLLDQLIKKTDSGIEFGSGRSTRWFARRCQNLTSIEHHEGWYKKVKSELNDLDNVKYILANVNLDKPEKSEYLSTLLNIPDATIDFVVNDGKIRDWVAHKTIDKLKPGGVYILDNAERYMPNDLHLPESIGKGNTTTEKWESFIRHTLTWRKIWTLNGVTSTLILFKP